MPDRPLRFPELFVVSMLEPELLCLRVRVLRCIVLLESLLEEEPDSHPVPPEPCVLVPSLPEVPDL